MKIEFDLLNNSYDYLKESIELFAIADEDGIHETRFSNYNNKRKWKMAYITLVLAFELLVKECLRRYSSILIFENLDTQLNDQSKTVTGPKGVERLSNCNPSLLTNDQKSFIKECMNIRNGFIHYNAVVDSAELKPKYCKLYEVYYTVHMDELKDEVIFKEIEKMYGRHHLNILSFAGDYVVFRNEEMTKENQHEFLKEIVNNYKTKNFIDKNKKIYTRIPYGKEEYFDSETSHEFCPDCSAAIGEYHYEHCDIEVCPVCDGQKLSCGCELEIKILEN